MDNYDREMATINMVNRLNARNAAQAADNRELYIRQQLVRDLIIRGHSAPELLILVLGDADAADAIVADRIRPEKVEEVSNDRYTGEWTKYVARKIMAQRAMTGVPKPNTDIPAPAEDETVDDLPVGFNEEEDNLEFPEDESEVTEE
jgi:hypothetical protein